MPIYTTKRAFLTSCTKLLRIQYPMSFPRYICSLKPTLTAPWRAYSSLNRSTNIPFNFFSSFALANMASTALDKSAFPAEPYKPKYDEWPYNDSDFTRYDEDDDGVFYNQPRLVTHIDDPSIARLTQYYDAALPKTGSIMDMCTSWKSFYPPSIKAAIQKKELQVLGVGLNAEEMALNGVFQGPEQAATRCPGCMGRRPGYAVRCGDVCG
jgi:hypothetical protein